MLPTFVIGLREGLEAALIVGIIAAFLGQRGRRDALPKVWLGVGLATLICVAFGIGLHVLSDSLDFTQQERLETVIGVFAVMMVTYMVFWMSRHAGDMKGDLVGAATAALAKGSTRALVMMAFLAVLREGFETVVFLLAVAQSSQSSALALTGALLGIAIAAGIGYGVYRGGVRLNMARFFKVTGAVLVVVAAGLVMSTLHTAWEGGWISFGQAPALNLTWLVKAGTPLESLFTGVLGIQARPTVLEVFGWLVYLVPMLGIVLWPKALRRSPVALLLAVVSLVTAACVSQPAATGSNASAGNGDVTVTLTDGGCEPSPKSAPAGVVNFKVNNGNANGVSEAELLSGGRMLGEQENLSPGLSGGFSLRLDNGSYQIYCPGASQEKWDFTVTGTSTASWRTNPALVTATQQYATYITGQVGRLATSTQSFVDAVNAGNLLQAEVTYGAARVFYEQVEPVAEIWGSLDLDIDGRIDDFDKPADFQGFHKIEQLMFEQHTLTGAATYANTLLANVQKLQTLVGQATYQPAEIADGATSLIDEIQKTKVTGEEERYSHIDLVDFQANLDGSMRAFAVLAPALRKIDPDLAGVVQDRYDAIVTALAPYKQTPGYLNTGYVNYTTVGDAQRKTLSQLVNVFAEEMSKVAGKVA
jgi:iron uptake system component EfeO